MNPTLFPKRSIVRKDPIDEDVTARIFRAAEGAKDWLHLEAYALVVLALCTGLRPKELRLANIEDLDIRAWTLRAEHVKGEGSYGRARDVPIRPEGRPIIERYLCKREELVIERPNNRALFPALGDLEDGYFAPNSLARLKKLVQDDIGTKFELRACRRTFGQGCIDEGLPIETVSLLLGHATSKTTETYYCRKRQDVAIKEAQALWSAPKPRSAQNARIDFQEIGYLDREAKVRASGFGPEL